MRVLVAGARGMLGTDVVAALTAAGHEIDARGRAELDVTDPRAVTDAVRGIEIVVNCTAWTAVDDAEEQEAEAFAVNATGAQYLARASEAAGAAMVHVSTDYVFDGKQQAPYAEEHAMAPRSAYGRTKAAGEWAVRAETDRHWILRTAWLYGANGGCFPKTIARIAAARDEIAVVADQIGQPTWTVDVADLLVRCLDAGVPWGTYHATSSGQASWHEFAQAVVESDPTARAHVAPTTSAEFTRPAPRPLWSVLGHDAWHRVGIAPIGDWHERWRHAAATVLGLDPVTSTKGENA